MRARALSSGGERFLDTEEVGGSNPPAPTTFLAYTTSVLVGSVSLALASERLGWSTHIWVLDWKTWWRLQIKQGGLGL